MRLRTRFYIYSCIISLLSLILMLLVLGGLNQRFLGVEVAALHNFTSPRALLLGILGQMLLVIFFAKLFFENILRRLNNLNKYFKELATGTPPRIVATDAQKDELAELSRALLDLHQTMSQNRLQFEENYKQLEETNKILEENYIQSYNLQLIQEEISRELDIEQLLKKTADIILGLSGSRRCAIYMADEENEVLIAKAESGFINNHQLKKKIPYNMNNLIARSWREKVIYTEADAGAAELDELHQRNINSILTVPLTGRQGRVGIMVIEHELNGGISADFSKFARVIAQELSLSVENAYLYDKMRRMAIHDALTGIYNRLYLMTYMAEVFAKGPKAVSVLICDLDHFKTVNDKYGHLTGDIVLKTTASLIQKMLPTGILARYGGEEFVIVLPGTKEESAAQFANSIRQLIEHHRFITPEGAIIPVTISIGLANYPMVSSNYEGLLQSADEALYEAKNSGRNKVCIAKPKD